MKCIDEIPAAELKGKRVLVRAGLDVPLGQDGEVSDMFRVKQSCQTLQYLSEHGAKVVIISHIGRDPSTTNAPVARALNKYLKVFYVPDLLGVVAHDAVTAMNDGEIVLLENIRQHYDLEKANDPSFAASLASLGDVYVNDAFSNSHREHASMVGIPKLLPSYAGFIVREEVKQLEEARTPQAPSFAILGGAKFETKAPLIALFLEKYDHVFVVGALINDVFKARGLEVGVSLISAELPSHEILNHPRFLAPVDITVEMPDGQAKVKKPEEVLPGERIVDIGPDSIKEIAPFIEQANFVLWNGPTGIYEKGYTSYTHAIAELLEQSSAKKVIGGGDTIAAIEESGVDESKLGFLSTGGGAMLEYLLKGSLPGIKALN